jgi:hypothetical protein
MKLTLTPAYVFTFLLLTFVLSEFHEIAHIAAGRLICGCWGKRDFNQWDLCTSCDGNAYGFIATLMGPIFSFAMAYWGAGLLKKKNSIDKITLGFSMIFASTSFGRLVNVWPFGGGDEFTVFYNQVFQENRNLSLVFAFILIALIIYFPLKKAYLFIENKNRILWFLGFCLFPFIAVLIVILGLLNTLLASGFMADDGIMGSPKVVNLWTFIVLISLYFTRKNLKCLVKN